MLGDAVGDGHARQAGAVVKRIIPDVVTLCWEWCNFRPDRLGIGAVSLAPCRTKLRSYCCKPGWTHPR